MLIIPKHTITVTPYRGKHETILEEISKKSTIAISDDILHINIDYTHYIDLIDIDSESEDDEVLQIENRVCEETYLDKSHITSISKQIENATTKDGTEHVYMIVITARGTISNIRCKHNEEASEVLQTLFNWWKHNTYPKEQDLNITA